MAIYEILASSTSEIQGITCFIIQLFIAEAMFFFHLKKRKRFWLRLLVGGTACLLLGVTLPIIIGQYISGIRTFIVLVFMQLYMWFCFRRSFLDILFCTIGAFTVQNLGSNIQVLICIVTKTSFKMLSTEMVIGFTIVYIICYLTCAAKIKNFPNISQNRVRVLWVAIISLCVCWLLQSWLISEKLDMVMACRVPFVFCCILSLFMQFGLLEQSRLNEENLALEQLIKENAKQYELSKKTVEIINMKCHDLKHRILELEQAGNADHGQLEEIRKAVDIYDGLAKTGCQPLDIILSEKNLLCEKYQIKFSYMIDGEKLTGIKSGDIAAIFGNALDNAIECAAELPVEKRIISLIGYARQDVMGIHIENYCESIRRCAKYGIKCVTYNFMPVFDWTRTELDRMREDGTTVLAYNQDVIDSMDPEKMFDAIKNDMNGTVMPGWEPERMEKVKELFELYKDIDEEKLFENLKYFLEAIMPVCDKYDINMAIHPDDPSWSVFGLPRIISSQAKLKRLIEMVPNKHNGVTFCMGSYGTNLNNDLVATVKMLKGRIHFAHIRNLRFNDGMRDFEESAHLSSDGTFDMHAVMKALYETGFEGPIRPDHGRMIWGEKAMPGYGLYDRALGAAYLCGLWEAIEKEAKSENK